MDFREYVRSSVSRSAVGVEFGPSYNPVVPKAEGYTVFVIDHADEETLRDKYRGHPVDIGRIEPVDAIDDGGELTNLLPEGQQFDYIVASHVFEHLPDPIGFLQRCERALAPGGRLFLMLPDRRFTFDYFRPVSTLGDMLEAYLEGRTRHDPRHLYDHTAMSALRNGAYIWADRDDGDFSFSGTVAAGYAAATAPAGEYVDCHAWVFVPSSFRLLLADMREAGLTGLGELEFHDTFGIEFFVVLSVNSGAPALDRVKLGRQILEESVPATAATAAGQPALGRGGADGPDGVLFNLYETRAPSNQTAVDSMADAWVGSFPPELDVKAGTTGLWADGRIDWMIAQLGGIDGKDILELGPLEASHTATMLDAGASSVLAIEANRGAYLRCLITKELRGLTRAKFLLGDFTGFLERDERRWPLIVACGVLYHMEQPLRLLEQLAARTDRLYLWTHVVDETTMPADDPRRDAIIRMETRKWRDRTVRHHLRPYGDRRFWTFCGGIKDVPAWLDRHELLEVLAALGFDDIRTAHEDAGGSHGPSLSILAQRSGA